MECEDSCTTTTTHPPELKESVLEIVPNNDSCIHDQVDTEKSALDSTDSEMKSINSNIESINQQDDDLSIVKTTTTTTTALNDSDGLQKNINGTKTSSDSGPGDEYIPPEWALSCPSDLVYKLEVIKNGVCLTENEVNLSIILSADNDAPNPGSYCLIGRQPELYLSKSSSIQQRSMRGQCVQLAHPSVSRFHAVFQYGKRKTKTKNGEDGDAGDGDDPGYNNDQGWYLMDCNSTHGTFVNKRQLHPGRFYRIHVGHVIKFGHSTRLHVVQGPSMDCEDQTKETWSEWKALYEKRKKQQEEEALLDDDEVVKSETDKKNKSKSLKSSIELGCDWGMSDFPANDPLGSFNLLQQQQTVMSGGQCLSHEKLYRDDPKRTLNNYFEREGIDPVPQYEFLEAPFGKQHCRIELPLSMGNITAEVIVSGKRKEAIVACALEACQILDRFGEFDPDKDRSKNSSKRIRSQAYWEENDYYSSDEDTFTDRTGQVERKRLDRMRQLGVEVSATTNKDRSESCDFDVDCLKTNSSALSLLTQLEKVGERIVAIEERLAQIDQEFSSAKSNPSQLDELEAYMNALTSGGSASRMERSKLKAELFKLRQVEMVLFKRSGLTKRATVHRNKNSSSSTITTVFGDEDIEVKSSSNKHVNQASDAAAAVRAAKQRLLQEQSLLLSSASESDAVPADSTQEDVSDPIANKNIVSRSNLGAIKRSLAAGSADNQSQSNTKCDSPNSKSRIKQINKYTSGKSDDDSEHEDEEIEDNDGGDEEEEDDDDDDLDEEMESKCRRKPTFTVIPITSSLPQQTCNDPVKDEIRIDSTANVDHDDDDEEEEEEDTTAQKDDEVTNKDKNTQQKKPKSSNKFRPMNDEDYIDWIPPINQQGDGITSLNAKFGY